MPIFETNHQTSGASVQINIEMDSTQAATPYGSTRDAKDVVVKAARDYFSEGMALARHCAGSMVDTMKELSEAARPDEVELELAIKIDAQAGAVLTKLGAEAQLQVRLKWIAKPTQ